VVGRTILIAFAGCAAAATSVLAVDYPSMELAPGSTLTLAPDGAVLATRGFDFTFPMGWKVDLSDVGFVYASVAKDPPRMIAISSCSLFASRDCLTETAAMRTRFLTSTWKGETGPPTKVERNDNVEEYTRFGAEVNRVTVRTVVKAFFSSSDYVILVYYSPVASESEIEGELVPLLNGKLHLRMHGP
jgi:hypothetical protein